MRITSFIFCALAALCINAQNDNYDSGSSWKSTLEAGKGKLIVHWHPNNNFSSTNKEVMDAIEHDLIVSFIEYTENKYQVTIDLDWRKATTFNEVLHLVTNTAEGVFGASSISIVPQRKEVMNFTPPHFPDIGVIVANGSFSTAKTHDDFTEMFKGAVMVTIPNTTLEKELLKLNTKLGLESEFVFVNTGGEVFGKVEAIPNAMGYTDLANFMIALKQYANIKRQYFYPIRLEGLAFAFPKQSDWTIPVNDYFSTVQFQEDKQRIIKKYLGDDVNEVIDRISKSAELGPYEEILLLTEEKEQQAKELLEVALREQDRQRIIYILIVGVFSVIILSLILYIRYQIKARAHVTLAQNQELIQKHNEQLMILNQEKNDLIRVLAHDLRNPINQISGFAKLLLEGKNPLVEDQKTMLRFMMQSSEKLRDMIAKILDVDAIESGGRNIKIEELDANILLNRIESTFIGAAKGKAINFICTSEADTFLFADKVYLSQVLENLVSNAIKFSQPNGEVIFSVERDSDSVLFTVADQGPGFSDEDQKRMFKKYQQLSAKPTAGEPSTGLGLSIVKMYTEMMNGSVTFETIKGKGTKFFIRLPRVK